MQPSLSPLTVQRLAYVRFLYWQGIEQMRAPRPLSASALLSFHDAVENLLGLVAEHLDAEVQQGTTFLGYWAAIKPKRELPGKHNMKRLNDARVALKHGGTFPAQDGLEQYRETVLDFFTTVVPNVFDVDFQKIDMVDLVVVEETAQALRDAETHADAGDIVTAMAGLSYAFKALLRYCGGRGEGGKWRKSPFSFDSPTRAITRQVRVGKHGNEPWASPVLDLANNAEILSNALPPLREALQVISLGIDYAKYARFQVLTPEVATYGGAVERFYTTPWHRSRTAEDYESCRSFVIESALIAASAHAVLELSEAGYMNGGELDTGIWPGPRTAEA